MDKKTSLSELVELLAERDWARVAQAERALLLAGPEGQNAVLAGMTHANPRIRRACAGFMDHHGDDVCITPLLERLLHDPVPNVRREAVHLFSCDRCKNSPLGLDAVPVLLNVMASDPNKWVRYEAIAGLSQKPVDSRVIDPMRALLRNETDRDIRRAAQICLRHHDPTYREECARNARVRQKSLAGEHSPRAEP